MQSIRFRGLNHQDQSSKSGGQEVEFGSNKSNPGARQQLRRDERV